jgi:phenylalanyl-tRNA synthetase beta chain
MRVPLSWLDELVELDASPADPARVAELAATFADLGLVPEAVEAVPGALEGVVVARVEAISPIEGADRIRAVVVDAGSGPVEVVCGAWNFAEGDVVALATVGTTLPGSTEPLRRRKMRGATSSGMLCSAAELGFSTDGAGILLLDPATPVGAPLGELPGLGPDVVFDLEIQANRPDCLSVVGVARDLAARVGARLRPPAAVADPTPWLGEREGAPSARPGPDGAAPAPGDVRVMGAIASVGIEAGAPCGRLDGLVLEGIRVGTSAPVVARRLSLAGMRPRNSVVDASNYVMLETGQPTHPYDLDRLGAPGLVARRARPDERLVTLDGVERLLEETDCVIADASGAAVGIAGVMGGESSEIVAETSRVLVEAAWFEPLPIAQTARRLGLRTEASARFEKGCDPEGASGALARIAELLGASRPGEESAVVGEGPPGMPAVRERLSAVSVLPAPPSVAVRVQRVNELLGTALEPDAIAQLLEPMGFGVGHEAPERLVVEVPSWRPDCAREIDIVEEVARQYGYGRIVARPRRSPGVGARTPLQVLRWQVRRLLAGLGADEAWTATLLAPGAHLAVGVEGSGLAVANPMVAEEVELRSSLLPGLLGALARNVTRQEDALRLFEIGRVFRRQDGPWPAESEFAALLLAWPGDDARAAVQAWRTLEGGLRLQPVLFEASAVDGLHPGRSARLRDQAGCLVGVVGELDPAHVAEAGLVAGRRIGWLAVDLAALLAAPKKPESVVVPSRFPTAEFDLAFVVDDETPAAVVEERLRGAAGALLVHIALFDVFRGPSLGEGRRSLAWRLRVAAPDRTLGEEDLAQLRSRCVAAAEAGGLATLRS